MKHLYGECQDCLYRYLTRHCRIVSNSRNAEEEMQERLSDRTSRPLIVTFNPSNSTSRAIHIDVFPGPRVPALSSAQVAVPTHRSCTSLSTFPISPTVCDDTSWIVTQEETSYFYKNCEGPPMGPYLAQSQPDVDDQSISGYDGSEEGSISSEDSDISSDWSSSEDTLVSRSSKSPSDTSDSVAPMHVTTMNLSLAVPRFQSWWSGIMDVLNLFAL